MKFSILFTFLKLISILVKSLSNIYVEMLPHVISYVFTGFCLALCFVCRKLEGLTSDQYLRVVSLQEKSNEDGTQCV